MKKTWVLALGALFAQAAFAGISFELPWMNSTDTDATYKTSDYPGSVFVLETYFLGCPYCNDNAPNVDALAEEYGFDMRVQVLDLGIDQQDSQYEEWIRRHEPNHPVVKDVGRKIVRQLGTRAYPSVYVVDCKGNVAYSHEGEWDSSVKSAIRSKVKSLLSGQCQ